jgi:hypothetical protein
MLTETKWIVESGDFFDPNPPEFDTKREAIEYFRQIGQPRKRWITKRTTIVEDVTPPPLTDD